MSIQFISFNPFTEYKEFVINCGNCDFDFKPTKFFPTPFLTNENTRDIQKIARNKEIELLNQEISNLKEDDENFSKKKFLLEKIKYFMNLNSTNWKYKLGIITKDVKHLVTQKKQNYTQKDIAIMVKVLLSVYKNTEFQKSITMNNCVETYLGKTPNIRILYNFNEIFGIDTLQFLYKMLSYFVHLAKPEFISITLQIIDIFSNKTHMCCGFDLHKEILKNYDIRSYRLIYEKEEEEEEFGREGNCDDFYQNLEEKLNEKINEKDEKKVFKAKTDQGIIDKIIIEAKKYVTSKIKKTPFSFDKNIYIWRYSNVNFGAKTINWYLGNDYPEKAHPKHSEYISIEKFIKFLVDTKKIFIEREIQAKFANLPTLA